MKKIIVITFVLIIAIFISLYFFILKNNGNKDFEIYYWSRITYSDIKPSEPPINVQYIKDTITYLSNGKIKSLTKDTNLLKLYNYNSIIKQHDSIFNHLAIGQSQFEVNDKLFIYLANLKIPNQNYQNGFMIGYYLDIGLNLRYILYLKEIGSIYWVKSDYIDYKLEKIEHFKNCKLFKTINLSNIHLREFLRDTTITKYNRYYIPDEEQLKKDMKEFAKMVEKFNRNNRKKAK
jgi:hypothetical protein